MTEIIPEISSFSSRPVTVENNYLLDFRVVPKEGLKPSEREPIYYKFYPSVVLMTQKGIIPHFLY